MTDVPRGRRRRAVRRGHNELRVRKCLSTESTRVGVVCVTADALLRYECDLCDEFFHSMVKFEEHQCM